MPFGSSPYLPSQAQAGFTGFLTPKDFPTADYCAKCHEDVHSQWRQSGHANSFRAPFYLKNVQMLIDSKGIEYTRHCEGCHNPVALFTGALSKSAAVDRAFDEDGITCSVCHSIEKVQNTSGTGSYVMGRPAVMVDAEGKPLPGLPTYDEILAHPDLHRKAVMRPFYRTSEFCAVCHKAAVPKSLNGYRWLRMFAVYDEWQNSSWAKQSPLPFYKKDAVSTCQTCHMPSEPIQHDYTQTPGKAASHRWLGANTAIPTVYGYQEQLDRTTQFLKTALKVDLFGIERHGPKTQFIAPLGVERVNLRPGETITADVLIQNIGAGHNLVSEQRDFYESWVEFTAKDAAGHTFFHSGGLDDRGFLEPTAHSYTNRLLSASGQLLDLHQVWETKVKGYDNTIPSGRSDLVRYSLRIPADVKSPIVLTATVNYRRFRRGFTNFVFPDQREFPIVSMATASITLSIGPGEPPAPADPSTIGLRWNNYGIALLGQQEYWAAEDAFKKVIAMKPGYADAYINLALAQYSTLIENKRELPDGPGNLTLGNQAVHQFDPALGLLEKALQVSPDNPRALFYQGLVLRQQGKLADAAAKQQQVLLAFPRSRQVLQELAYIYYLQEKYDAARREFEALQSINSDDLTAHYYLGIVYSKLGMTADAKREAAAYAEHREDPTMGSVAQDFWRANPTLVNELRPYHTHETSLQKPKSVTVGGYLP
jgi:tetratricopeptide (TPR) repeat protein